MEISVCLIVKNEEKVLARCLDCIKKFADEIIVVDTGSKDKTKSIAQKYTDKVYDFEWMDDFAKARNFSFSKATKDYVMWIDADDTIKDEEIEKLRKIKSIMKADTYMLKYAISFDDNGKALFCYYRERILKRENCPKWEGFVHEVIPPFEKVEYLDITIEHHKENFSNGKRNLKLYNKHLKNGEVFSSRAQYYYSKELFYNGYFQKCAKELKKFFKMDNKFMPNVLDAYLTLSRCEKGKNKLETLLLGLKEVNPSSEYLCEIGQNFIELGKIENAIFFYETALQTKPDMTTGQFVDKNFYYLYPYLQLTMLYYWQGDYEKAKKYHLLSKKENPNNPSVIFNEKFFT